jgi:hypothetical protein
MTILRAMAATVALTGTAVGMAGPAWADEQLNGDYAFTNGPVTNTWSITTQCNQEGTCGGTISTSTGLLEQISRLAGGPWTIERTDVPNGWTCPDGSIGPADLVYSFDPVTLVGTLRSASKPGVCNDPNSIQNELPISLVRI